MPYQKKGWGGYRLSPKAVVVNQLYHKHMTEKIPTNKKKFYKGPSLLWSLILHISVVGIIFILLAPYLFVSEKKKNIVTVDVINEEDISQKLPDPAFLGKQQTAKPKPIGGKTTSEAINKNQNIQKGKSFNKKTNQSESPIPSGQQGATLAKQGDSDRTIRKLLKTIDEIRATPNNQGTTTANQSRYATRQQSTLTNDELPIGQKDALSADEFSLLRQQISQCWQIPAGLRDIDKTKLIVVLTLAPNGKIKTASLKNKNILKNDTTRVLAESALRSFETANCQRLKLPKEKYPYWKTIEFTFDPYYAL
ncbi:MAG: hypothetical protein ACR2NY_04275 [Alphaproteobacteria bacterium]